MQNLSNFFFSKMEMIFRENIHPCSSEKPSWTTRAKNLPEWSQAPNGDRVSNGIVLNEPVLIILVKNLEGIKVSLRLIPNQTYFLN